MCSETGWVTGPDGSGQPRLSTLRRRDRVILVVTRKTRCVEKDWRLHTSKDGAALGE